MDYKKLNETVEKVVKESNLHALKVLKNRDGEYVPFDILFGNAVAGYPLKDTAKEAEALFSKLPKEIKIFSIKMNDIHVEMKKGYTAEDILNVYDIQSDLYNKYVDKARSSVLKYETSKGIGKQKYDKGGKE